MDRVLVAHRAAAAWTGSLPTGGTVILTEAGRAFALVGYSWTYLGRIDAA